MNTLNPQYLNADSHPKGQEPIHGITDATLGATL